MENDANYIVDDNSVVAVAKRPMAIWLITILYGLGFVGYVVAILVITKSNLPQMQGVKQYYASLSVLGYLWVVFPLILSLAAVVSLFLLKRITLKLWLAVIVLGVVRNVYHMISDDVVWSYVEKSSSSVLLSLFITIAVYLYARNLDTKGLLK